MVDDNVVSETEQTDEQAVSKTVAGDEPVVGSIPTVSSNTSKAEQNFERQILKKKNTPKPEPEEDRFKLNVRRPDGTIRYDIKQEILYTAASRWGDIMNCIPSHRLVTLEEIAQLVWDAEKRNPRRQYTRSRKQIEDCIAELLEMGLLAKN